MKHSKKPAFRPASSYEQRHLSCCMARIEEQRHWLHQVRSVLPAEIAAHIVHVLISGARLLIYTYSASWASQIRFYDGVILNKLQASGQQKISKLQVKLLMPDAMKTARRHARLPSADTVDSVFGPLDSQRDDALGQALARLGRILKQKVAEQEGDAEP
jgi:hypothetical protein